MIVEITKDNLSLLDNSFVDKEYIKNELDNNPYAKVVVLIENDKVIAYLYYSDIYERAEINQIEVDSFHRNSGKGTLLMDYLIKTVDKDITLEVKKDNVYAIKLYENKGFKEVATRSGYYNGVDGILMERKKETS